MRDDSNLPFVQSQSPNAKGSKPGPELNWSQHVQFDCVRSEGTNCRHSNLIVIVVKSMDVSWKVLLRLSGVPYHVHFNYYSGLFIHCTGSQAGQKVNLQVKNSPYIML